jgi:hypothetical protein
VPEVARRAPVVLDPAWMSLGRLLLVVVLGTGCQRLPSLTPLADTGGTELEPSARVDRRSSGQPSRLEEEAEDEADAEDFDVTVEVAATDLAKPDAGAATDAGGAVGDAGVEPNWPGEYYGSDRFAWRGADGREMVEVDDRAHTRVEADGPKAIVISVVNSATGDVICPLHATTLGNRATIRPKETCFGSPDQAAIVTDGRATLDGDRLVLDFRGHLDSSSGGDDDDDDDGGHEEGTYHFDGRRR